MFQLLLANLALFFGALLQGVAGYGIGTLSAPIVFLISPNLLPGPMIASATFLNLLMLLRNRDHVRIAPVRYAIEGGVVGIVMAGVVLKNLTPAGFDLAFGVLILFAVFLSVLGWKPVLNRLNSACAGWLSGFMGTITAIGGPPIALVYQNESGSSVRGNLAAFFLVTSIISLVILMFAGMMGWPQFVLAVAMCPGVALGFAASKPLANRFPYSAMRPLVLSIAAAAGLLAVYRALP